MLECHESGPEIIVLVTVSISLITAVISLITTIINRLPVERKSPKGIRVIKRRVIKNKLSEETLFEINIDISKQPSEKEKTDIENVLKEALLKKK